MVTALTSYFMEKNLEYQKEHARNASQFLQDQLGDAKGRLMNWKSKCRNTSRRTWRSAEFAQMNPTKIQKMNDDIGNLDIEIRQTEEERAVVSTRLSGVRPLCRNGAAGFKSTAAAPPQARLEGRPTCYPRDSAAHPLVEAKKREIKLLDGLAATRATPARFAQGFLGYKPNSPISDQRFTDKYPAVQRKRLEIEGLKKELEAAGSNGYPVQDGKTQKSPPTPPISSCQAMSKRPMYPSSR